MKCPVCGHEMKKGERLSCLVAMSWAGFCPYEDIWECESCGHSETRYHFQERS